MHCASQAERAFSCGIAGCLLTCALSLELRAAEPASTILAIEQFKEGLDDQVNVNGAVLTGLSLGTGTGISSLRNPVDIAGKSALQAFCVRISSIDGLFWSENPYTSVLRAERWRIDHVTRRHLDGASRYAPGEMVVVASLADGEPSAACGAATRVHVPAVAAGAPTASPLRAFVNAGGRNVEASLTVAGAASGTGIEAECRPLAREDARFLPKIADYVCEFALPKGQQATDAEITLTFSDPPFGEETWVERIQLPTITN